MKSVNFDSLTETKVTVPLILLAGLVWLGWNARELTIDGLDQFFFTDAAASELTKAVQANTDVLSTYIKRQEIRDVSEQIQVIGGQITETQLWVAANGENPIATARLGDLVSRRTKLTNKKNCLLNDNIIDKGVCEDA